VGARVGLAVGKEVVGLAVGLVVKADDQELVI